VLRVSAVASLENWGHKAITAAARTAATCRALID
jgi:hypothetical protein